MTKFLLETGAQVVCIELDSKMIDILSDRFSLYGNFNLINADVLKVDLKELIRQSKSGAINKKNDQNENCKVKKIRNVKIIANLPYYITTPIIMKLLEGRLDIDSITVMVQKEVADRLVATPGEKNAGAITYTVYYYANTKRIFDVKNTAFIPEPEVMSSVINFEILKEPRINVKDEELFFKVIKSAFMQKRKTLVNGLVNSKIFENKNEVEKCFNDLNIDLKIRGEKLSINEFGKIADYIYNTYNIKK